MCPECGAPPCSLGVQMELKAKGQSYTSVGICSQVPGSWDVSFAPWTDIGR